MTNNTQQPPQQGGGTATGSSIKALSNLIMFGVALVVFLIFTGHLNMETVMDVFLGDVEMTDTEHIFDEGEFMEKFDLIVGEVEIHDTSSTKFERRNSVFCDPAYVKTTTHAMVKYEVVSDANLFHVDVKNKTYFISPKLGVTYHEADKHEETAIQESNCVKEKNIKLEGVNNAKQIARDNFKEAINNSDKLIEARVRFQTVKRELLSRFKELGYLEIKPKPSEVFQD